MDDRDIALWIEGIDTKIVSSAIKNKDGQFKTWVPYLFWFLLGSSFTVFDEIHVYFGIMDHSNNIVHQNFPSWFSPNYGIGGVLFYAVHRFFFPKTKLESVLGGKLFDLTLLIKQIVFGALIYLLTGILCGRGFENTVFPFLCGAFLIIAAETNANLFTIPTIYFAVICVSIGVGFEWFMSYQTFGFKHGVCPSISCLGTNVSMAWLPSIYLVASSIVHKMISVS